MDIDHLIHRLPKPLRWAYYRVTSPWQIWQLKRQVKRTAKAYGRLS